MAFSKSVEASGRRGRGKWNLDAPAAHTRCGRLRHHEIESFRRSSEILTLAEVDNQRVAVATDRGRLVVDELALGDERIETVRDRAGPDRAA